MKNIKYSQIISENKKIEENLKAKDINLYKIGILSNIMIHQSKSIGEYYLRKKNIYAEIKLGDFDNIWQDSKKFADQDSIIIFWN